MARNVALKVGLLSASYTEVNTILLTDVVVAVLTQGIAPLYPSLTLYPSKTLYPSRG